MPNTMLGNETNLYPCNELSNRILDNVGSKDTDHFSGTVTGDGKVREFDGISAREGFTGAPGASPWVWSNVNGCGGYFVFINRETTNLNGATLPIAQPDANGGPNIFWDDFGTAGRINAIRCGLNISSTLESFALGREMKVGEKFVWAWSLNHGTKGFIYVLKSDDAVSPIDMNASGTIAVLPSDNIGWHISSNTGHTAFFKMGVDAFASVIGQQFTLSELQADADTLLLPEDESETSQILPNIYMSGIFTNRIIARDVY